MAERARKYAYTEIPFVILLGFPVIQTMLRFQLYPWTCFTAFSTVSITKDCRIHTPSFRVPTFYPCFCHVRAKVLSAAETAITKSHLAPRIRVDAYAITVVRCHNRTMPPSVRFRSSDMTLQSDSFSPPSILPQFPPIQESFSLPCHIACVTQDMTVTQTNAQHGRIFLQL